MERSQLPAARLHRDDGRCGERRGQDGRDERPLTPGTELSASGPIYRNHVPEERCPLYRHQRRRGQRPGRQRHERSEKSV